MVTNLRLGLVALPAREVLSNEVEIFLVKLFFFVAFPPALLLLSAFAFFRVLAFFLVFVFVDNEPFMNLQA